eukprot:gene7136-9620_t
MRAGDVLVLVGPTTGELGASMYLREVLGREDGAPPPVDLALERRTGDMIRALILAGDLRTVHDLSDGGLVAAAAEMAMASNVGLALNVQGDVWVDARWHSTFKSPKGVAAMEAIRDIAKFAAAGCTVRGDAAARALVPAIDAASAQDWDTEYLDAIASVAIVDGLGGALAHIAAHGSHHTDAIVAGDEAVAERFLAAVDSAIVLWNASTQFADGGEFGLGAEIGIATGRLHARGPVALEGLTTYKWVARGTGQELALIEESGMTGFPPRLPEQPIFYPVAADRDRMGIGPDGIGDWRPWR